LISSCPSTKGPVKVFGKVISEVRSIRLMSHSAQEFKNWREYKVARVKMFRTTERENLLFFSFLDFIHVRILN